MNTIIFLTIEIILFVFSVILIKKHVPEAKQPFKKILSSLAPIIVILALIIISLIMEMKNTSFIDYDNKSLICSLIIFIILIITFILWILFGKNNEEKLKTVEYYSPAGLDPAQMGYAISRANDKKLIISLILNLVSKKYIKIIENNGKQYLVNLCVLNIEDERDKYQKVIGKDLSDLKFSNINELKGLSVTEKIVYNGLFYDKNINDFSNTMLMTYICRQVYDELNNKFKEYIVSKKSITVQIVSVALYGISFTLGVFNYFLAVNLNPKYNIIFYFSYVFIALIFLLTLLMKKNTYFGDEIISKIKGFKSYLEKVEKDKLDALVLENPNYFYDILPYAYVLGVSKKWVDKFETEVEELKIADYDNLDLDLLTSIVMSVLDFDDKKMEK